MARNQGKMLEGGDAFPPLALTFVDGTQTTVAEYMRAKWGVLLLYRGGW